MMIVSDQVRIREDGRKDPSGLSVRGQSSHPKASTNGISTSWFATTPADEAWRPLAEDGCPLVKV